MFDPTTNPHAVKSTMGIGIFGNDESVPQKTTIKVRDAPTSHQMVIFNFDSEKIASLSYVLVRPRLEYCIQ